MAQSTVLVRLTAPFEVVERGRRKTYQAGDHITVSYRTLLLHRDRMLPLGELAREIDEMYRSARVPDLGPLHRPCTKSTPACPKDYNSPIPDCCRSHNVSIMDQVGRLLDEAGIPWWVDYGTVLGAVRHGGKMIPHDKDADCGVLARDKEKFLGLEPRIRELGLHFRWRPPGRDRFSGGDMVKVFWSAINKNHVDYFFWYPRPGGILDRDRYVHVDRFKGREFPADRLFPLQRIEWEGLQVWAPRDMEWFCEHRYGAGWRTPIHANHDGVPR